MLTARVRRECLSLLHPRLQRLDALLLRFERRYQCVDQAHADWAGLAEEAHLAVPLFEPGTIPLHRCLQLMKVHRRDSLAAPCPRGPVLLRRVECRDRLTKGFGNLLQREPCRTDLAALDPADVRLWKLRFLR